MKNAMAKLKGREENTPQKTNKKNDKGPRKFYFEPTRDPNAMDVDFMTTEERNILMRKGACFTCKMPGHISRSCPHKKKKDFPPQTTQTNPPQKMKGKELHAHVRSLLAEMEEDDVNEFFADATESGF